MAIQKTTSKKLVKSSTKTAQVSDVPNEAKANLTIETRSIAKKPQLIEKVALRAGLKKRDAKVAIEATLASIAELLEEGFDLSVPPLGKIRVVKSKPIEEGATIFTAKIRTLKKPTLT